MLYCEDLKPSISVTSTTVECPVLECTEVVARRRRGDKRSDRFRCPRHDIYLSPTRFEYADESDNLLWNDNVDAALLREIKKEKRECRLEHNSSEDAVTWNVIRYLQKTDQIGAVLTWVLEQPIHVSEIVYWSYSQQYAGVWPWLAQAREVFKELPQRSTEPDTVIVAADMLFWIEAKFHSGNITRSTSAKARASYLQGSDHWFEQVFSCGYDHIAVEKANYELMRMWLLGTWIAAQMHKRFVLLNLVCDRQEEHIENHVAGMLRDSPERRFKRTTWESIGSYVAQCAVIGDDRAELLSYLAGKALGYDHRGRLIPGFN